MSTVGDVGHVDEEGYVYLTDRAAFMIISGGVNIYPQECENLLITHPKVADAAVFGVPNDDMGEEVKAVVQLMPGLEPGAELEAELIGFCRDHLAHHKCPRSIDFEAQLPRSADRQALQAPAARPLLEGPQEPDPLTRLSLVSASCRRARCASTRSGCRRGRRRAGPDRGSRRRRR